MPKMMQVDVDVICQLLERESNELFEQSTHLEEAGRDDEAQNYAVRSHRLSMLAASIKDAIRVDVITSRRPKLSTPAPDFWDCVCGHHRNEHAEFKRNCDKCPCEGYTRNGQ